MKEYDELRAMQGTAERFVQIAEELRLTGRQLFRDGIVANDQVLSKIKKGWQKPTQKAIDLLCEKYGVSASWLYTGEGIKFMSRSKPFDQKSEPNDEKLFYNTDFESCLDREGKPISTGYEKPVYFPIAGDIDFWCFNKDNSLAPTIMQGDVIALKKLSSWKEYIPENTICVVVTKEHKVLRKVSVSNDNNNIAFTLIVDGKPMETKIPKNIIIEIYKVVGNFRRQ